MTIIQELRSLTNLKRSDAYGKCDMAVTAVKVSEEEDMPLYGWGDELGNKYVSIIDTTNHKKRLGHIRDYGACALTIRKEMKGKTKQDEEEKWKVLK